MTKRWSGAIAERSADRRFERTPAMAQIKRASSSFHGQRGDQPDRQQQRDDLPEAHRMPLDQWKRRDRPERLRRTPFESVLEFDDVTESFGRADGDRAQNRGFEPAGEIRR